MQAARAAEREARTQALYRLTKELAGKSKWVDVAQTAAAITREEFRVKLALFFPDEPGKIRFESWTAEELPVPQSEVGVAQWVFDHGQNAGYGTDTLPGSTALYLPLKGSQHTLGVMAVAAKNEDLFEHPEQLRTLELFASQAALAIERAQATAAARDAQLKAETEQMRSGLLSAVSHDLRTPLATITGAASSLLSQRQQMSQHTQSELLESILQEAERLSRLVGNLLEMTRLESGAVVVKREWHPLEEIVGAALTRLDHSLEGRAITTDIPDDLPLVSVDDVLLEQVFLNVLENAVKYTPTGSPLGISARAHNQGVEIEFTDSGGGFEAGDETRIWEKFYRGSGGTEHARGAGLGLAICRAIMTAHGGTIEAENRVEGGALIRIWLPSGGTPPEAPIDA
jgi:two-component system sensor histidine kinase KdpD